MNVQAPAALACLLTAVLALGACTSTPELKLEEGESPADLYVRLAAEYYRRGETEVALRKIEKGLEEDSKNPRAHNIIATIYQSLGRKELAEKHFRTSLRLAPNDSFTLTAYGSFLCEQKKYAEANDQFKKALANRLYTSPWVTMTRAGICYRSAGNSARAEEQFRRALSVNPRFVPALVQMAELDYAQGRYKSARGYLNRAFTAGGYSPSSLLLAVRVERRLGSRKRARAYERKLRTSFPGAPEILQL